MMKWNQFVNDDAFNVFPKIDDNCVDLTFTSLPDISQTPFQKDIAKYQELQNNACDEMSRITKPNGFVVISQTDRKINGEILTNHITYHNAMTRNGFKLKDYKIMVRNYPVDKKDMYYFNYQHCLIFTKKGTIKRNGEFLKNILVYDTVKMKNMKGPLQLYVWNEKFIKLMINYLSKDNDKIFDPFAGSGIVPYIAKNLNRQYLGCEISEEVYNESIMKKNNTLDEFMTWQIHQSLVL